MDIDEDNIIKVSDESLICTEQMEQFSPEVCNSEQDVDMTEDSCLRTEDLMDSKEIMDVEVPSVHTSETEFENSSINVMNPVVIDHQPSLNEPKDIGPEIGEKYERNLQKFLADVVPSNTIGAGSKESIRKTKSDGEAKMDYCGDMSKISSTFERINVGRSSAPPTFSNEVEPEQNSGMNVISALFKSASENVNQSTPEDSKFPISFEIGCKSLQDKDSDLSQSKSSEVFKIPVSPNCLKTNDDGTKSVNSPVTPKTGKNSEKPNRPTDLNVKTRKTFYTFSPDTARVIRQCQSLPSKSSRQKAELRRSINLEPHSRIVRALFKDEQEPCTPENKISVVAKSNSGGDAPVTVSREESSSFTQGSSSTRTPDNVLNEKASRPKAFRKLNFHADNEKTKGVQPDRIASFFDNLKKSPTKRKETSPIVESSTSKKIRNFSEFETSEEVRDGKNTDNINLASGKEKSDSLKQSFSIKENESPMKFETDQDSDSSIKTDVSPSKVQSNDDNNKS